MDGEGNLRIADGTIGKIWGLSLPDTGVDLSDPWFHPGLTISPNGECLLISLYEDTAYEENLTRGSSDLRHVGSWIAPLEPDTEWIELDVQLVDWWQMSEQPEEPQPLPAQDFGTPISSESSRHGSEFRRMSSR